MDEDKFLKEVLQPFKVDVKNATELRQSAAFAEGARKTFPNLDPQAADALWKSLKRDDLVFKGLRYDEGKQSRTYVYLASRGTNSSPQVAVVFRVDPARADDPAVVQGIDTSLASLALGDPLARQQQTTYAKRNKPRSR